MVIHHTEIVAVPGDLLVQHQKTTIPESITYGEAMLLWSGDRSIIDPPDAQIKGIASLEGSQ